MKNNRTVQPILILTISLGFMADTAGASTRGFEESGNPVGGLGILLLFCAALVLFCVAYLLLDRLKQQKISRMKHAGDIDGLIKALGSPWLGRKAAQALGDSGDERAVEPLIRELDDKREDVRKMAAEALGKVGDARAIEPLSHAMSDSYDSVRISARAALDNIRKRKQPETGLV